MAHTSAQDTSIYSLFGYSAVDNPCRYCEKRTVGCHGSCEDYADYRKRLSQNRWLAYKERQKKGLK